MVVAASAAAAAAAAAVALAAAMSGCAAMAADGGGVDGVFATTVNNINAMVAVAMTSSGHPHPQLWRQLMATVAMTVLVDGGCC